jgi:ssDNA-binding Zn-finger/Zn-ribbon topoisomerase 1
MVETLLHQTNVSREVLQKMGMERLRVIYQATKPKMATRVLPANWKKSNKADLLELWINQAMPFYSIDQDETIHITWNRDKLVVELERFVVDAQAEAVVESEEEEGDPVCPLCAVPMCVRTDRSTMEQFWGCQLYPECTETMSMKYKNPAPKVSSKAAPKKVNRGQPKSPVGRKQSFMDSGEEMNGEMQRRAVRTPVPSEDSWKAVSLTSGDLQVTPEELAMIKKMRDQKE